MKKSIAIIPARMGSSRFPGKPMAKILDIPMVGHVYLRTKMCQQLDEVYVATCDQEIFDYITSIGGKAVMTKDSHERCTDRVSEALLKIEKNQGQQYETIVLVQGDEPLVSPNMLSIAMTEFAKTEAGVLNLMKEIEFEEDYLDPNEVKVVFNGKNEALYFSREPIPSRKKTKDKFPTYKQVCIIPFTREFLFKFSDLAPTPLEIIESVDMMRVLEHGFKVQMAEIKEPIYSVDTPDDLAWAETVMKKDPFISKYKK
jgi:3-deoxy-manno-octulosonate cytidylyltransferase (CMP-KDO synthetase)